MTPTPTRVANRLVTAIKRFQAVLSAAKSRDVNESDTVIIVTDDFLALDTKNDEHLALVYALTKEGWLKEVLTDLHQQKQILSKFVIAAVASSEPVLDVMRRELKRISPDVKLNNDQIQKVLLQDVLKREVVEGDKADEARKKISRAATRQSRARAEKANEGVIEPPATDSAPVPPPAQSQPQTQ